MIKVDYCDTGLMRGYASVNCRKEHRISLKKALKCRKNSNDYKLVARLVAKGATYVTKCCMTHYNSTRYMSVRYTGYRRTL